MHQISQHRISSGRVGVVTYDHGTRGNSFTASALAELVEAVEAAASDEAVVVIRLELAGRNFCTGWDTAEFTELAAGTQEQIEDQLRNNDHLLDRLRRLPTPIVAAIRGRVSGFGVGLLQSVHISLAAHDATLSMPEVEFGICPGGVLHALLSRAPRPAVNLLVLSGAAASADEMRTWGLVSRVVESSTLEVEVAELVTRISRHPDAVLHTVSAAVQATADADSAEPAYQAAARSIVTGGAQRQDPR